MPPSIQDFDIHQARHDLSTLTQEWRTNIQEAFSLIDSQNMGSLNAREWPFALQALGFTLPKPDTYTLLCAHGVPPDDWDPVTPGAGSLGPGSLGPGMLTQQCPPPRLRVSREVFEAIAAWLIVRRDPNEEAEAAWHLFDPRSTGRITIDSLRQVCQEVNSPMTEADLKRMIDSLDLTGKGWVSKEEFLDMARGAVRDRR